MTKGLQRVDLELHGVQHTFDYGDEPLDIEEVLGVEVVEDITQLEIAVGNAVLKDVTSLEVILVDISRKPSSGLATLDVSLRLSGTIQVDLEELEQYADRVNSVDDVADLLGNYIDLDYDIERGLERGDFNIDDWDIESCSIDELYDEDGEPFEFE